LKTTETQLKYDSTELHTLTEDQLDLLQQWSTLSEQKKKVLRELIAMI